MNHLDLPQLGHQLKISPTQKVADIDDWVCISPVFSQRLKRFGVVFIQGFLAILIVLTILFLPDFIFDYSKRDAGFIAFFAQFFIYALVFLTLCAVITSLIRDVAIYLTPGKKRMICALRLTEKNASQSVELSEFSDIKVIPPNGIFKRSQLVVHVRGTDVILAECYGNHEDLIALRDWLIQAQS